MPKQRLYFDYAASTPVAPEAEAVMRPYFLDKFGNAGSLHSFGQEAIAALDEARETIANAIGAGFREIIFTGSATEANNLAIRGAVKKLRKDFPEIKNPEIIVSAIEHESVLETARSLADEGIKTIEIPVNDKGIINTDKLKKALGEKTILVSMMYANNEIGAIQPIKEISKIISEFRIKNSKNYPLLHTDAVQAFQFLDCNTKELGADLMTLSAHKIYGPKGIGILYAKNIDGKTFCIKPVITGGGQEFGMRSGTENISLAVGFAKAVSLAVKMRVAESKRISALRDYFWRELKKIYPAAKRNGGTDKILPNFLNVYFPDFEAADLLTGFDLAGLAVSAGSACSARSSEPSYVIEALGGEKKQSSRSIRITLGRPTSKKDIDTAVKIVRKLIHGQKQNRQKNTRGSGGRNSHRRNSGAVV